MRALLILLMALLVGAGELPAAPVDVDPLSMGDLDAYFSSIHPQDWGLAFKRNPKSRPLVCQIGSGPAFVSNPGSVFEVKFGSHFRLFDKKSEIKFRTFGVGKGLRATFLVEETTVRNEGDDLQVIHVGLVRLTYSSMAPVESPQLVVEPVFGGVDLTVRDLSDFEKFCSDYVPKPGEERP